MTLKSCLRILQLLIAKKRCDAYKSYFRNLFKLNLSYQFVAIRCRICSTVFFITLITVFVFDSSLLSENGNFKNFPIRKFQAGF